MSRVLGMALALVLAAAALYGMQHSTPGYGDITSPIAIDGKAGERVEEDTFAFGVARAHLARSLRTENFGKVKEYTTSGVWLLVEGAGVAKVESLTLTSAEWLGPTGIRYALSQRFSNQPGYLVNERLDPGLPTPLLLAFEVPEKEVAGGRLLLARSALIPLDEQLRIDIAGVLPNSVSPSLTILRSEGDIRWAIRRE
ncbi:hypothetical protein [Chelativorans sp.]|uniref:hypothetical protein n=1 Tax=Chelativorans sp. TaxID=2203393 RepID=UPI0028110165|nr:hypothetical protein [Chelativorans sp.]